MSTLAESFIQLSYESGKWEKWLLPNSKANTRELAIIAGHYVFSTKECSKIKAEASRKLQKKNIEPNDHTFHSPRNRPGTESCKGEVIHHGTTNQ